MASKHDEFREVLVAAYEQVKEKCESGIGGKDAEAAILALVTTSVTFLTAECDRITLKSLVAGKTYLGYARKGEPASSTRPVRDSLFLDDSAAVLHRWHAWAKHQLPEESSQAMLYTAALAPCLAMELFDRQNKKGPATYFECFIGHVVARLLGIRPDKGTALTVGQERLRLTMDFLFAPPPPSAALHVAVKMSTRERVVQAWAHQRILDSAFGVGKYRGILVVFSETKLDVRKREVVEICVPDQWLAYQTYLAKMARIYYFDPPRRYLALSEKYPDVVTLKPFASFLAEKAELLAP